MEEIATHILESKNNRESRKILPLPPNLLQDRRKRAVRSVLQSNNISPKQRDGVLVLPTIPARKGRKERRNKSYGAVQTYLSNRRNQHREEATLVLDSKIKQSIRAAENSYQESRNQFGSRKMSSKHSQENSICNYGGSPESKDSQNRSLTPSENIANSKSFFEYSTQRNKIARHRRVATLNYGKWYLNPKDFNRKIGVLSELTYAK